MKLPTSFSLLPVLVPPVGEYRNSTVALLMPRLVGAAVQIRNGSPAIWFGIAGRRIQAEILVVGPCQVAKPPCPSAEPDWPQPPNSAQYGLTPDPAGWL